MSELDEEVLSNGTACMVFAVTLRNGRRPAWEFLQGLEPRPRAQFRVALDRMAEQGQIQNEEVFKKLAVGGRPDVYEFKARAGWRLYAIQEGKDWAATHGAKKHRSNRKVAREAERARDIYASRRRR